MKYLSQFVLLSIAIVTLIGLQYQYWMGNHGYVQTKALQEQLQAQQTRNTNLMAQNRVLVADVEDLKTGSSAVEEHARLDLGLIKQGETFVQFSTAAQTRSRVPALPIEPADAIESVPTQPAPEGR